MLDANQAVGNYWIRANPSLGSTGFDNGINSAILRYEGAPNEEPTTTQGAIVNPFDEVNLSVCLQSLMLRIYIENDVISAFRESRRSTYFLH